MVSNNEILKNLKDLKDHARKLDYQLEKTGLSPTDGNAGKEKSALFDVNINDITSSVEGLLRGESPERHLLRLQKAFPEAKRNLKVVSETKTGRVNVPDIQKLVDLLKYFEQNYRDI